MNDLQVDLPESWPLVELPRKEIMDAAIRFVEAKTLLDKLSHDPAGCMIISRLFPKVYLDREIYPYSAASRLLPFFNWQWQTTTRTKPYKALVPAIVTMGQSWRWQPSSFKVREKTNWTNDLAQYGYIKSLGIVLAHEGKNRVALFKERQWPYIPAMVSEVAYPEAHRIRIFNVKEGCFAVLDNRYVEIVVDLAMIQNLFQAYGVEIESQWPQDYPSLQKVLPALLDRQYSYPDNYHCIDMCPLAREESLDEMEVPATLLDLQGVELPIFKFILVGTAISLLLLMLTEFAKDWKMVQGALIAFSLCAGMLSTIPLLRIFKCKVKFLKENPQLDVRLQMRRRIEASADA